MEMNLGDVIQTRKEKEVGFENLEDRLRNGIQDEVTNCYAQMKKE